MIKMIKISASAASVLLVLGMVFKSQHLMGANAIFTIGVFAGVFTTIMIMVSNAGKFITGLERFNITFSSLAIAIIFLAFLFKVMHWPGAAKLIWVADVGLIVTGILFLVDGVKEKDPTKSSLKIMTVFFILFLLLLISLTR